MMDERRRKKLACPRIHYTRTAIRANTFKVFEYIPLHLYIRAANVVHNMYVNRCRLTRCEMRNATNSCALLLKGVPVPMAILTNAQHGCVIFDMKEKPPKSTPKISAKSRRARAANH